MAARTRRIRLDESWREKIQTSMLINRLHQNAIGEIELTATQQKSIEILLRKSAPDLQAVTISGDEENPLEVTLTGFGAAVDAKISRIISANPGEPENEPE